MSTQYVFWQVLVWAKCCVVLKTKYPVVGDMDQYAPQVHSSSTAFDLFFCSDTALQCKCGVVNWDGLGDSLQKHTFALN